MIEPEVPDKELQHRRRRYFKLSSHIAQIDNARLRALFDQSEAQAGWGKSQVLDLGGSKVFVKRVPVTNAEHDNMFSTANLYGLPTFYNYGFGSVGLGVSRELVTHIKATNWVLAGATGAFPLLYHYRIIPAQAGPADTDPESDARYVAYWGSDANIGRYMRDRAGATRELVLFLEHFPHTVGPWLLANPSRMPLVLADMRAALTFLGANGILHLDAHFFNMVTDGRRVYLTDFGLALDRHFALTAAEQQFHRQNSLYDFGYLLWSVGSHLFGLYRTLPEAEQRRVADACGAAAGASFEDLFPVLVDNVEQIVASGVMQVDRKYAASVVRYRPVILFMHSFYAGMRRNNAKDTPFEHAALRRLLQEVGFGPGPAPRN